MYALLSLDSIRCEFQTINDLEIWKFVFLDLPNFENFGNFNVEDV